MILVDAVYICQSGGKKLLDLLIDHIETEAGSNEFVFLLDTRIRDAYMTRDFKKIKPEFLKGSEIARYKYYQKNKQAFKKVICFANVPPPIRLHCTVLTFFQNILLFDKSLQKFFPLKQRLTFALKGFIIRRRLSNTTAWIAQTGAVKMLLLATTKITGGQVSVIPFFNNDTPAASVTTGKKEDAFFFPAIGAAHKNHDRLIGAWRNLYRSGKLNYPLHLTIDKNQSPGLYAKINTLREEGIPLINHGYLAENEVNNLYARCKFVIHPSLGESFGLVLLEAINNNCVLLAPSLPYVKAVVIPDYYFDACETHSIEATVIRAITENREPCSRVLIENGIKSLVNYIQN